MNNTEYRPVYENSFALIIGIDDYIHAAPLENACADAESVAEILSVDLGFSTANVTILKNADATRANITEKFSGFECLAPNDRLFFFFAGHGFTTPSFWGRWVPSAC